MKSVKAAKTRYGFVDMDETITTRFVLTELGRKNAHEIECILHGVGLTNTTCSPRGVTVRAQLSQFSDAIGCDLESNGELSPDEIKTALKKLKLDEFVEFFYFPSKPEYFG